MGRHHCIVLLLLLGDIFAMDDSTTADTYTEVPKEEPSGIMTEQQYNALFFATSKVIQPAIGLLGVVGNLFSLLVFSQPHVRMASSIRIHLTALCLIDLIFLTLSFYESMLDFLQPEFPGTISMLQAYGRKYEQPIRRASRGASSFMVVIIAFERFSAISSPLSTNKSCFKRHPYLPIACVILINITFCTLTTLSFNPVKISDDHWTVTTTSLAKHDFLRVYGILAEVIYQLLPMALVSCFNIYTVSALYIAKKDRQHLSTSQANNGDAQASRMLLGVAVLFNICILPSFILGLIQLIHPDWTSEAEEKFLLLTCFKLARLLSRLNSSANFIVYVMTSQKFCSALVNILRKDSVKQSPMKASTSNSTGPVNSFSKY